VILTGADLTVADVEAVARRGAGAELDPDARSRMEEARAVIDGLVADGALVYGVTTGFGDLASTFIEPAQAGRLQENLLMSHAAGVGEPFPREVVRAMLLLRANTLALGHSGCRPLLVDRLLEFLRVGIHPVVPEQGSVGASGDLAPLAHLGLPIIGRGQVEFRGQVVPSLIALREAGLEPLTLEAKEGLALLNGTQMMSAIGALLLADADRLVRTASVAAALSVEALLGTDVAFSAAYQLARPHPGQIAVAAELRYLLRDSGLQQSHHGHAHKVQDPYSLRCVPQVHGAVRDALDYLRRVLDIELNSATDNPLVFPGGGVADVDTIATGGGRVISGGNFHGEPVALALDLAKLAIAELGSISERRTALLVDARLNGGLPPFLASASGVESGMMIYQYTAAALASEHKVLAHPASVDSIPTSANQEDHVSMGSIAARHARAVLTGVERILAIELVVAAQALDLRLAAMSRELDGATPPSPGVGVAEAHARIRRRIAHLDRDREPGPDLAAATALVHEGGLADLPGAG
jgi:histidine ammonia-lyase